MQGLRERVCEARKNHPEFTCEEIGFMPEINLSRERVRQLLKEAGLPTKHKLDSRRHILMADRLARH